MIKIEPKSKAIKRLFELFQVKEEISLINIIDYIRDGLTIDGAHHKQKYLELILKEIISEEKFKEWKYGDNGWSWIE